MKCPSECLKVNNPLRNLLAPALVFVVSDMFWGYLLYMALFKDVIAPYESMWRPIPEDGGPTIWCVGMMVTSLFYGFLISLVYTKLTRKIKDCSSVFGFAFTVFFLGRFIGEIYSFLMYPYSASVMFLGLVHGLAIMFTWALICKRIFVINTPQN